MDEQIYIDALNSINPCQLDSDEWVKVAMAAKAAGIDYNTFDIWCHLDEARYNESENRRRYDSIDEDGKITAGTLMYYAGLHGYHNDSESHAMSWRVFYSGTTGEDPQQLIKYLKAVFKPGEYFGAATTDSFLDSKDGKYKPKRGWVNLSVDRAIEKLSSASTISEVLPLNPSAGAWIRFNPLDGVVPEKDPKTGKSKWKGDEHVTDYRYTLIEYDDISIDQQIELYKKLNLPIKALVKSGGKSVHAIVHVDAANAQEYAERVRYYHETIEKETGMKADPANKNPSRFSRMPGVMRNGTQQTLLGTDLGCKSFLEWQRSMENKDEFLSLIRTLDDVEEQKPDWLVPGRIPKGTICLHAGNGGTGKTALWCNILAGITTGKPCILDDEETVSRGPQMVAFLSGEDSVSVVLKKRLRTAEADTRKIIFPDLSADKNDIMKGLKIGSAEFDKFIQVTKPAVCVIDPIQAFLPPGLNMGSRNAMRNCLDKLIPLGEQYGTVFLIIVHTNKRMGASGRDRIADTADLWDIARSVFISGYTDEKDILYLSHEKSNYGRMQDTILYRINENGSVERTGTSYKKDHDYVTENIAKFNDGRKADKTACKEWIRLTLSQHFNRMEINELSQAAFENNYSKGTLRGAKEELEKDKLVKIWCEGFKPKKWYIALINQKDEDLPFPVKE